ncbi:MAG: hypothetical protein KIC56_00365 [Clostridium sp.]|nr:hypothetical protein [Clostridium sp.]
MKKNIKNKNYTMKEAVSYYILGYKRYEQNTEQNGLADILKNIVQVAQENIENKENVVVSNDILNRINFDWLLSANDLIDYAVCIFYVLINREIQITDEKIVKEFLKELHLHHPRKTMKEAEIILENCFPELKN